MESNGRRKSSASRREDLPSLQQSLVSCECHDAIGSGSAHSGTVEQNEEVPLSPRERELCLENFTIENYNPPSQTSNDANQACNDSVACTWRKATSTYHQSITKGSNSTGDDSKPAASPTVERKKHTQNTTNSDYIQLMGRITVYTVEGCSACRKSKMLLTQHKLPYLDIDIGKHAGCGQELFRLTSKYSVPQIFFNEIFIGGLPELETLFIDEHKQSRFQSLHEMLATMPLPTQNGLPLPQHMKKKRKKRRKRKNTSEQDSEDHKGKAEESKGDEENESKEEAEGDDYEEGEESETDSEEDVDGCRAIVAPLRDEDDLAWRYNTAGSECPCIKDPFADLIASMRKSPNKGGLVKDRTYHLRRYNKCFIASEAVDFLVKRGVTNDRTSAVALMTELMNKHYFHHVVEHQPFMDEYKFFRFLQDEDYSPLVLNPLPVNECFLTFNCTPPDATQLAKKLRELMLKLYGHFLADDGSAVDYAGIASSELWTQYKRKAAQLTRIDLSRMDRANTLSFFINVYNVLVIHGNVELGPHTRIWNRYKFFSKIGYVIGGLFYSLDDIEHGILRANSKPPFGRRSQFKSNDPRLEYALEKLEPRVHFALVCGAKSCPAISTYQPDTLDSSLDIAARAFFQNGGLVIVDAGPADKKEVKLSKILYWYSTDFGANENEVLAFIAKYAPPADAKILTSWLESGKKVKFTYMKYDWSSNNKSS